MKERVNSGKIDEEIDERDGNMKKRTVNDFNTSLIMSAVDFEWWTRKRHRR